MICFRHPKGIYYAGSVHLRVVMTSFRLPALFSICAICAPLRAADLPQVVEFNRDIRPILSDKCYTCHGPDSSKRFSKLRFDTESGAKQLSASGHFAIVPGDSAKSGCSAAETAAGTR